MITNDDAGTDGVSRVRGWLLTHGIHSFRTSYVAPFDLYTEAGTRIEVKSAALKDQTNKSKRLEPVYGWFFNIHRHGVLKEENVDFYALRCEPNEKLRALGFNAPIHIIRKAPLGCLSVNITVRSLFAKWAPYVNGLDRLLDFDVQVSPEHRARTLELACLMPTGGRGKRRSRAKKVAKRIINREAHAAIERARYNERVKKGLCHKCGKDREPERADRTTCRTCGEKESARLTAYYRRRAGQ